MNPTVYAMRRPVTTLMLVVALISGGILAYNRMRVDIFPSLNTQAPLGLAVIGGLVMSTFATLLVLPSVFALVIGKKVAHSPSIYPDDPESSTTTRRSSSMRSMRAITASPPPMTWSAITPSTSSSAFSGGSSMKPIEEARHGHTLHVDDLRGTSALPRRVRPTRTARPRTAANPGVRPRGIPERPPFNGDS